MMNDDQGYAYGEYVNDLAAYMKDATTYMMGYMSQKDLRNGIDSAHLDAEATARAFERSAKNMANRSGSGAGAKRAVWDAAAKQAGGWADEARNSGSVDAFWKKMDSALKPFVGKMGAYGLALNAASLAEAYQDGKSNEVLKELAKIGSGIVIGALVTMSLAGAWPAYAVAGAIWVGSLAVGELIDAYWPDIDNDVAHNFLRGKGVRNNDPLALDLDGDGLETSRFWGWNNLVTFDHDADRIKTGTGWLDADDGWLVLDRNGNGLIDSGRELFGDNTLLSDGSKARDGFEALAQQDSNGDGNIDASDSVYSKLRVWQDLNQDGVSQDNELKSLEELGIDSLGTNGKKTDIPLGNLNHLIADGEFTRSDGSNGQLADLNLAHSNFLTEFVDKIELTDQAKALPEMRGSGLVRSLREAASLSPELAQMLERYSEATTRDEQMAMLDELLLKWSETSTMATMFERARSEGFAVIYKLGNLDEVPDLIGLASASNSQLPKTPKGLSDFLAEAYSSETRAEYQRWFRMIGVMERFNGEEFIGFSRPPRSNQTPLSLTASGGKIDRFGQAGSTGRLNYNTIITEINLRAQQLEQLEKGYEALKESVYFGLATQTRLSHYLDNIEIALKDGELALDFGVLESQLEDAFDKNAQAGSWDFYDFTRAYGKELQQAGWNIPNFLSGLLTDHEMDDASIERIRQTGYLLDGNSGNDWLKSSSAALVRGLDGRDVLNGSAEADVLEGGDGNDRLFGGDGDDILTGGKGNDWLKGDRGVDTYRWSLGDGDDVIERASSIDILELGAGINASDIRLHREHGNLVISFADHAGSIQINEHFRGNGRDRYALGSIKFADGSSISAQQMFEEVVVAGGGGRDYLKGREFNDHMFGFASGDWIYGEGGDDLLDGGLGNDQIYGGAGDDILIGGEGDDRLCGNGGVDRYRWDRGDGRDTITRAGRSDHIQFADSISQQDLWFSRSGNDLLIDMFGDSGSIRVSNWYRGEAYHVGRIETADGVLEHTRVEQLVQAMAVFSPPAGSELRCAGQREDQLQPVIAAAWEAA